ncbi:Protein Fe65-like protein [Hypsibius exemplaris]|uniref:Protein Fe65-like protein n=1 Tax=Hypsibius exemplaris TaxID=2072580 RepID=A0A1W0XA31_HYPEX|nr:Protein Fe65-like protein [Hypsibius exemplaris]
MRRSDGVKRQQSQKTSRTNAAVQCVPSRTLSREAASKQLTIFSSGSRCPEKLEKSQCEQLEGLRNPLALVELCPREILFRAAIPAGSIPDHLKSIIGMDQYAGQEYEEDDMMSFANTNYAGTIDTADEYDDDDLEQKEMEFQNLLDHRYQELCQSPDYRSILSGTSETPDIGSTAGEPAQGVDEDGQEEDSDCEEDIYKALDEFYVKIDRNGGGVKRDSSGNNAAKLRQKYPDIDIKDMGVPNQGQGAVSFSPSERDENLPFGWEKHEDDDGPYYWHIKSGTIQRHPPPEVLTSDSEQSANDFPIASETASVSEVSAVSSLDEKYGPKRFPVRSMGWMDIEEDKLTPERSSSAVNRCILDMSAGRNDTLDGVGRWGDGKDIFLELYPDRLCLVDPVESVILHSQPIQTIKVWGVGRDDNRDFAFVARDLQTDTFKCYVLRCDFPARRIARALKEVCQTYIVKHSERSGKRSSASTSKRPHTLSLGRRRGSLLATGNLFPTPTEEPKKVFKVLYVGRRPVKIGVGIEGLHSVIDQLLVECPEDQWVPVSVLVSPSTIGIVTQEDEPEVMAECRVRYLTFLGIGRDDVRSCGFIVHTPEDTFLAHIFACTPSAGPLCKAIEAACKLRYQKFLDAQTKAMEEADSRRIVTPTEKIGAKLRQFFGSVSNHLRTS